MWAVAQVKHPAFSPVVLTLILLNCIFLAIGDPTIPDDEGINVICSWAGADPSR